MESKHQQEIRERSLQRAHKAQVRIFHDFESENAAEVERRVAMSTDQRLAEFAAIRYRIYGDALLQPMQKVATWEYVDWHKL